MLFISLIGCENNDYIENTKFLKEKNKTEDNSTNIKMPEWVKKNISEDEFHILQSLAKEHKVSFFKLDEETDELPRLIDLEKEKNYNETLSKSVATILSFPRLRSYGEGGIGEKMGRCSSLLHSQSFVTGSVRVTVYFGYLYTTGKLVEIQSSDIDISTTGIVATLYFVSKGSAHTISSDRKEIEYLIGGDIRYKITAGTEVGVEVTLTSFSSRGAVRPNLN